MDRDQIHTVDAFRVEKTMKSHDEHDFDGVGMAVGMNNSTMRHVVEAPTHH